MGIKIRGDAELTAKLSLLTRQRPEAVKRALFEGAGVMANAMKAAVESLPVDNRMPAKDRPLNVISSRDKADVAAGVGIAHFQDDGDAVDTLVGFKGYVSRTEKNYPNGVPIPLIVRSIENGSSVRAEHPFVGKATRGARSAAVAAIRAKADEEIEKIIK